MEVRPGYKLTEVGVFPSEWVIEPLGNHATFRTGPFGSALHKSDYTNDGVPIVNPMHIIDGTIKPTRTMTVRESAAKKLSEFRMKPGEIVIGRRGDMGRCAVVLAQQSGWLCGTGSMIVRPTNADPDYLQRVLSSPRAVTAIEDSSVGTTMVNLNQSTLAGLKIQFPPLVEQRAIAAALSDVDALLGGLDRLIAKKRDLKQAAMQQLLTGQIRLPGFDEEWEMKRLGDIAEMGSGGTPFSSVAAYYGGDIPWVSIADMTTAGKMITATERNLTVLGFANCAAQMFSAGTVLYAMYASLGECSIAGMRLCTSQAILGIRPTSALDAEFLYYVLTSLKPTVKNLGQYGTQSNLNKGIVQDFRLHVPTPPEQAAIATVLSEMDTELAALEARRAKTRALKQGMMQELLTGRTRLIAPSSTVVAVDFRGDLKPPQSQQRASKSHNRQINEAVVLAVLVKRFGSKQYPLGRKRRTKLAYLMHRHVEQVAEGYVKKAAGPYNPDVKYRGPERIAQENGYIRAHRSGTLSGFVAAEKIAEAEDYFAKWYGHDVLFWLEQFRFQSNDELELLTTVDMAAQDLMRANVRVDVEAIKAVIRDHPEWQAKLERAIFSDVNIAGALSRTRELFPTVDLYEETPRDR